MILRRCVPNAMLFSCGLKAAILLLLSACTGGDSQPVVTVPDSTAARLRQSASPPSVALPLGIASTRKVSLSQPTFDELADRAVSEYFRILRNSKGSIVLEGIVSASTAQIVTTGDPRQQLTIATKYTLTVTTAWGGLSGRTIEYWVLGGTLPDDSLARDNYKYRSEQYSNEFYPKLGESLIVALSERDLVPGIRANRPLLVLPVRGQSIAGSGGILSSTTSALDGDPVASRLPAKVRLALDNEFTTKTSY